MDLVHELCPLQLLEVTKKRDTWAGWLASIQHMAHIWCWKRAPPLSTHIWHSERPPAFKLYMVLRACPAFNPYFAFRAPLCSESLNTKYGPAFNTKYSLKAGGALNAKYRLKAGHALNTICRFKAEGRSDCQIWIRSAALSLKMGVEALPALDLKFWLRAGAPLQSTVR